MAAIKAAVCSNYEETKKKEKPKPKKTVPPLKFRPRGTHPSPNSNSFGTDCCDVFLGGGCNAGRGHAMHNGRTMDVRGASRCQHDAAAGDVLSISGFAFLPYLLTTYITRLTYMLMYVHIRKSNCGSCNYQVGASP
jgi:hypothetical protein